MQNAERFADITALETGTLRHVFLSGHVGLVQDWFRYYAGWADKLEGTIVGSGGERGLDMIMREPFGVFAMVIPWNAPLLSLAMKVPAALATGNTMVIKPPEFTPFATALFGQLALEAGVPEGVINIIPGNAEAGKALVSHKGIDKISFTGGPATARRIIEAAAANMTPGLYELGGKSANVVFPDAPDLDAIAGYSVGYAFTNAGQGCTCPTRLIVHANIFDELTERVRAAAAGLVVGDPLSAASSMGPVISRASMARIQGIVERAEQSHPGSLRFGGSKLEGELADGCFISPAIVADVPADSEIATQELFGPVLTVLKFRTDEEALAIANGTEYKLAAYVQTSDLNRALRFVREMRAGGVYVNRTFTLSNPANTTGGSGISGYGREGGRPGLEEYLVTKGVSIG